MKLNEIMTGHEYAEAKMELVKQVNKLAKMVADAFLAKAKVSIWSPTASGLIGNVLLTINTDSDEENEWNSKLLKKLLKTSGLPFTASDIVAKGPGKLEISLMAERDVAEHYKRIMGGDHHFNTIRAEA